MSKFITGVAIGVIVGILIAPNKGSETRKRISQRGNDLKKQFNDFVDSWSDRIESWKSEAEDEIADMSARSETYSSQPYSA